MDALRRIFANIQKGLGDMSLTLKLLVAAVCVVLVLVLVIVGQTSTSVSRVELLPGADAAALQKAVPALEGVGIKTVFQGGRLYVSSEDANRARSHLAAVNALPADKALYFETLVASSNWMNSRQVNEQNFTIALQNELARTISDFKGVASARVMIDVPEPFGLGGRAKSPKASATVQSDDGNGLPQETVNAVAELLSGSLAGLTLENVTVVDAAAGRPRRATSQNDMATGTAMDHARRVEREAESKFYDMLSSIPGVVVTVTASVDVAKSTLQTHQFLNAKEGSVTLPKKTDTSETTTRDQSPGAEPGVAANQAADINRGPSGGGSSSQTTTETTETENHVGTKTETTVDPKGKPTSVAVTVLVPPRFVVALINRSNPPADPDTPAPPPPAADLLKAFEAEVKPLVMSTLTPQVRALIADANRMTPPEELKQIVQDSISVAMMPADPPATGAVASSGILGEILSGGGGGGGAGGVGVSLGGGLVQTVALGALAVVALGMMLMMVKKASKREEEPTAEELVGLPPALEGDADIVGEADEGETAMAGIEMDDSEMQSQKVLEQVGEVVQAKPAEVAKLVARWINVEE
jgi:flagellar M-ring protein FliF